MRSLALPLLVLVLFASSPARGGNDDDDARPQPWMLVAKTVIPDGWTDIGKGSDDGPELADVPREQREYVSSSFERFALSPDRECSYAILVKEDLGPLSSQVLDGIAQGAHAPDEGVEKSILRIRHRLVGRIAYEKNSDRILLFVIPVAGRTVGIVYTAHSTAYARWLPAVTTAVESSIVQLNPSWWKLSRNEIVGVALLPALLLPLGLIRLGRRKRTQRPVEEAA